VDLLLSLAPAACVTGPEKAKWEEYLPHVERAATWLNLEQGEVCSLVPDISSQHLGVNSSRLRACLFAFLSCHLVRPLGFLPSGHLAGRFSLDLAGKVNGVMWLALTTPTCFTTVLRVVIAQGSRRVTKTGGALVTAQSLALR